MVATISPSPITWIATTGAEIATIAINGRTNPILFFSI
jgi:hypothetical protein